LNNIKNPLRSERKARKKIFLTDAEKKAERNELKKKTGLVVDEFGRKIGEDNHPVKLSISNNEPEDINEAMFKLKEPSKPQTQQQKKFTPIGSYKPSGNLIYNNDLLNTLEEKLN